MIVEIWVPFKKDETGAWAPDIPEGIPFTTDEGAPTDFMSEDFRPFTQYFNILVDDKDAAECAKRIADKDVPERDTLIVEMVRACRGERASEDDWNANADAFFDGIPDVADADDARKQVVKDVLVQAVCRGLSAQKAEAIRVRLELPLVEEVTSGR